MLSWPNEKFVKKTAKKILSWVAGLKKQFKSVNPSAFEESPIAVVIEIAKNLLNSVKDSPNSLSGKEKYALIENLNFLKKSLSQKNKAAIELIALIEIYFQMNWIMEDFENLPDAAKKILSSLFNSKELKGSSIVSTYLNLEHLFPVKNYPEIATKIKHLKSIAVIL
jgi:hypothetical protein